MLSLLPHTMEHSWENWLSLLGMNDCLTCTNAEETPSWFNNDIFNNVVVAKQEYSHSYLKNSSQEELGSCYCPKRVEENEAKPRENINRGTKRPRTSFETQHHIMSERKRRQNIAEKFIALSAIIPGLKKIDKATVLGEAINYMRQLQQRIAVLEKENNNKSIKPVMITKSSGFCSASGETNSNEVLPEVAARGLDKDVLIRIFCQKQKGIMLKLLALLKDVHLSISSCSVLPFGNSFLNITIIAQMSEKYNLTMNDLVNTMKQIF